MSTTLAAIRCPRCGGTPEPSGAPGRLARCGSCGTLGRIEDPGGGQQRVVVDASVDADFAERAARETLAAFAGRVRFVQGSFAHVHTDPEVAAEGLSGALLDLGVSSRQLDADARGFTFRRGVGLDMRMDPGEGRSAAQVLAEVSRGELIELLRLGDAPRPVLQMI